MMGLTRDNDGSSQAGNKQELENFLIVGPIVHSFKSNRLCIIPNGLVAVNNGKICAIDDPENASKVAQQFCIPKGNINYLKDGEFLMPGLVDTHIHAPQYPNVGIGYDKPLLGWLEGYTFPLEAKYTDKDFAKHVYDSVVKRTLSYGTTTACYFSTIHLEGSLVLADSITEQGQRAFVGKVNMNANHPVYYGETTEASLKDTEEFINQMLSRKNDLLKPIITPRFAISCDMEIMKKLGALAQKYNLHIQTHISENTDEVEFVKKLFPDQKNYADVYDVANLLTNKTVLAHGIYLTDEEIKVIVERGSSVSHCPLSNSNLKSGICKVRKLLQNGVKVALGTDVSGGCSPSMIKVMQSALSSSIHLSYTETESNENYVLDYQEVFYLATLGGAKALAIDDRIGNFEVGKDFDALIISMQDPNSSIDILLPYDTRELVQKFIYLGDDRNVKKVYVSGKLVKSI